MTMEHSINPQDNPVSETNDEAENENMTPAVAEEVSALRRTVLAALDDAELVYSMSQRTPAALPHVVINMTRALGNLKCVMDMKDDEDILIVYMFCPVNAIAEMRTAAAVYLTYVNYGLKIGNFELDMNDGEIRFKISCHVGGSSLSIAMVQYMFGVGLAMMDRFFPGLMAVVYGGKEGKAAYEQVMASRSAERDAEQ